MHIFIPQTVPQLLGAGIMSITQMRGHTEIAHLLNLGQRRINAHICAVAFRRIGHIQRRHGQRNTSLGPADKMHRIHAGHRHLQRFGVSQANILGRADDNTAGNKLRLLTGLDHTRQIMQHRVRIRASHTFDKGGNYIIMIVTFFIIMQSLLLHALGRHIQRNVAHSVLGRGSRQHRQFQRIVSRAGVTAGSLGNMLQGVLLQIHRQITEPTLLIGESLQHQRLNMFLLQGQQTKNARPGQQRIVHLKIRVLGSCADQNDGAVLHRRQQRILLRLVKAVNLINEQHGAHIIQAKIFFGGA